MVRSMITQHYWFGQRPLIEEQSKAISLAERCVAAEEVPTIMKHLLAEIIRQTFNFFFVVILAGYIFLIFGVLKYYEPLYAVGAIAFMSPYFVLMLKALPLLKGFYTEKYATGDAHLP